MQDGSHNGHIPDDQEERKEIAPAGHPDRPSGGYTRGPSVPSLHDLAMINESSGQGAAFNLAKELITGSRLPEEYLPRGVYDRRKIARRIRLVSKDNRIRRRRGTSLNDSIWVGDQMSIALNGAGREDAKQVIRAAAAIEREERNQRQGFMGIGRPQHGGA